MKKIKLIIILSILSFSLIACNKGTEREDVVSKEEILMDAEYGIEGDAEPVVELHEYNYIEIDIDRGPEGTFYTMPMYYQKDFEDIQMGDLNIAKNGNLITCLSMMDSQYSADYITPDKFLEKYSMYINEDGSFDKVALIQAVAENNYRKLTIESLDVLKLPVYLETYQLNVLVHINHPSIYGDNSAYMVITGITPEGNLYVRDPIYKNREEYATVTEQGETVYSSFDFFLEAGKDATVYVMGGGEYDFEQEEYKDISELGNQ